VDANEAGPSLKQTLQTLLLGLAALHVVPLCEAQDTARMDEIVRYHVDNLAFMGSVLVARHGEVLFEKSYGSANLEWQVPHTASSKFQLGSITKQFTAAAILLLEERGALALDDRVASYVPDAPRAWRGITISHLLTHTSGIPDLLSLPEYPSFKRSPASVEQVVAFFRNEPLEFASGERMRYSNSGYVLLGLVIEQVSGQSYERFLSDNIFMPLGMRDSGYGSHTEIVTSLATGYARRGRSFVKAEFIDIRVLHGAGALYSTARDLLKWTQGLFGSELLTAETLSRMTTPFMDDYALGIEVREAHGSRVVEHGGGVEGFNTHLAYYPDEKLMIVVLGNINGLAPERIAWQLGAVTLAEGVLLPFERQVIDVAPERLRRFVGTYSSSSTANLIVTLAAGQLSIRLGEQQPVPLYPESETQFFVRVIDAQVEFEQDASGTVTALVLRQANRERHAPRIGGP
jgi:CubicO group peptidase (beta-lactamase class C family)